MPNPKNEPGMPPVIGIIGGSGVYDIDGLADARWETVKSSFGAPSDDILRGSLNGVELASCRATAVAIVFHRPSSISAPISTP